jgi:hypothetical protein
MVAVEEKIVSRILRSNGSVVDDRELTNSRPEAATT